MSEADCIAFIKRHAEVTVDALESAAEYLLNSTGNERPLGRVLLALNVMRTILEVCGDGEEEQGKRRSVRAEDSEIREGEVPGES